MKCKKLLTIATIGLLSLVGCSTNNGGSSSTISSSEEASSIVSSISSEEESQSYSGKYEDKYYALPEGVEEFSQYMSVGGALIDIAVDKQFVTGQEDTFSFSYTNMYSDTSTVISSNPDVFSVEKVGETNYKVKAVHEGNAVLYILDKNQVYRYEHIVYVRDPMSQDEMEDYLSDVEYWQSYAGYGDSYKMTFLFDNQVVISGSVSNVAFTSYTATYKLSNETDLEFQYTFTDDDSKNSDAKLSGFNISKTGDFMYLQYSSGTAAIMFPNTRTFD